MCENRSFESSPRRQDRRNLPGVRYVLTADHEIPDRPPIVLREGEDVGVGARDTEWPAFVFVTTESGSGWVPARHLEIDGASGVVRAPYDTTELPASRGQIVDVLRSDPESGWSWCRDAERREGWIPDRVLAPLV